MDDWIAIGETVLPIFALIVLGAVLRRLPLLDAKGWAAMDKVVYWVFFPALLFASVARADLSGVDVLPMAIGMILTVLLMTLMLFAAAKSLKAKRPARSSLVMGGIRFNTFMGVALAEQVLGETGLTLAAFCIAVMVPTVNVISVWTLQRGTPGGGMLRTLGALAKNPLIIACVLGAAVNLSNVEPEPVLMTSVNLLGQAALPLGLIAVGAGLAFDTLSRHRNLLILGIVAKMLIQPALGLLLLLIFGVGEPALLVAVLWLALPAAPSSYVMARTLGGDGPLMAALLTAQVIVSVITLPLLLGLLAMQTPLFQ